MLIEGHRVEHCVSGRRGTISKVDDAGVLVDWDDGTCGVMYRPGYVPAAVARISMLQKVLPTPQGEKV